MQWDANAMQRTAERSFYSESVPEHFRGWRGLDLVLDLATVAIGLDLLLEVRALLSASPKNHRHMRTGDWSVIGASAPARSLACFFFPPTLLRKRTRAQTPASLPCL